MAGSYRTRRRLWRINASLAALGIGLVIAYLLVSFTVQKPPYDYGLVMYGAERFCFDQPAFSYGLALHAYYPAPFYTTFCLPYRYTEPVLRVAWMLAPVVLALWLAKGRSGVLGYAPLGVLLLIGQSSWLVIPMYVLVARHRADRSTPWWYGLLLLPGLFKPHLAVLAWLVLAVRWVQERRWLPLAVWLVGAVVLIVPSFLLRPGWPLEWLRNGRGFEPVNLASVALIPVQLIGLGAAQTVGELAVLPPPTPGELAAVYGFCLLVGAVGYALLRWRRGRLDVYDWALLFFFVSPVLNDYDLVVLLPFVAGNKRRLLVALTAGIVSWVFAVITLRWSMSIMVTLALLVMRLWGRDDDAPSLRAA